jgi:lipopolysaccharide transport system permease protein
MTTLRLLARNRRLIWNLTVLDFKVRYAGSRIGLLWMLLAPVLLLLAYLLLFGTILKVQPAPESSGWTYALVVACGLLPWLGFSEGLTRGTASVLAQRNLLKSQTFPVELVPVTAVCAGLIGQLCGTALLLGFIVLSGRVGFSLFLLPVLILLQGLFTIGLVWMLSCINILYRDTSQVVGLLVVLLMFVSPIAFTQQMVPAGLELAVQLNPLSFLMEGYRAILLHGQIPAPGGLAAFAGLAVLVLLGGHRYFTRLRVVLPDLV